MIWMNFEVIGEISMNHNNPQLRFVLCIRNDGCDDLEPRKVYQVIPDKTAEEEEYIRVIDDSGEDYLYPADYFVPVDIPEAVARDLALPA